MTTLDRRTVLMTSGLALAYRSLPLVGHSFGAGNSAMSQSAGYGEDGSTSDVWPSFPSTDPALVRAVVLAAHTDVDTVAELVTAHPALSRASIDWGFGDWEAALGAASHMGRRDIVDVLIAHGARPNIFSAAMMGQLDVVRAFVAAQPGIQGIPGPHGITLLAHARNGGEPAAGVYEYLENLGDADPSGPETIEMSAEQRRQFVGDYTFGSGSNDYLEVAENREVLSVKRAGQPFGRRMFAVSESEFYPSGSPAVRIAFDVQDGRATALQVIDNQVIVSARKVGQGVTSR